MAILKRGDRDSMTVHGMMTREVVACTPSDMLSRAAQLMWEHDCGVIPVVEDGHVVGMITDRDCCMAAYTKGRRLDEIPVGEVMATDVKWCSPDERVADVARRMRQLQIRRMPVVLDGGRLAGILSMNDLALAGERGLADPEEIVDTLAGISRHRAPSQPLAAE